MPTPAMPAPPAPEVPGRPLILTDDPALLDDLARLAAAAGVEPFAAADPAAAAARWGDAPVVLVGADALPAVAGARWPRRSGVVVVLPGACDDSRIWEWAVLVGAEQVVELPDAEPWLVDRFADAAARVATGRLVAVVGGRGGAGVTTLASALAGAGFRRGLRTLLLDLDPLGGGIDLVFGGELADGLRWSQLAGARGRIAAEALAQALPEFDGVRVLAWDRAAPDELPAEAVTAVLGGALRGHDLVVADLPRRMGEPERAVLARAATTLLVVPAEVRAAAAAARVAARVAAYCADLRLVVRGPAPGGLSAPDIADALGVPLAGRLRSEPRLAGALDRGESPAASTRGPLAGLCRALLRDLVPAGERAA